MLRELLGALRDSPTASGLELRARLGLSRETYETLLAHLIRLGHVVAEVEEADCEPQGCKGCPIACQSTPAAGPRRLRLTERGHRFLLRAS